MSTRDNRTALQARFAGLGIAAFASFALLTATPVAALAEEAQVEPPTEEAVVEAAEAETKGDPISEQPTEGAAEEAVASDQATQDEAATPAAPAAEPAVADAGEVPAGEPEAAPTDEATPDEATSEEATEEAGESAEAAPATTDAGQATPEAAAPASVAAQASAEPTAESLPLKAEGDEEQEQEQEEPEKTVYQKGVTKVDGVLRYFSKKTTDASAYVKSGEYFDKDGKALYTIEKGVAKKVSTGHYVDKAEGVLYNIKDGKATKISMAGRNYYKCADGAIFFSPSKSSGALATGKKGWKTSSGYGSGKKRYYFHAEKGFIYTQYGYSEAGSYGVLTHKNGYAYTGNIIKGNKVFLILDDGKMLNLTSAQKKTYKYTTTGFRWAKKFGDKINRVTENTKELYFLHEYTSSGLYKGAYYVRFKKNKGFWEKAGDGLLYKNYKGKKATYKGPHYNQFYGAILRAVTDRGHNIDIVNAKMPVIHNKQVYLADSNGQLKKQSTKRSDWDSKVQQAYNVVRKLNSSTNYAITVSKTTHTVYLWYSADKRNNWQPMFACRCSTGSETYYDTPEGRVQPLWTPPGQAQTYDHRKYFAGCTYYATGYKKSPDNGWHLHSTIYNLSTGKRVDSRLGKNISNGCIRCNINYARYVYMYLPLRTRTFVY